MCSSPVNAALQQLRPHCLPSLPSWVSRRAISPLDGRYHNSTSLPRMSPSRALKCWLPFTLASEDARLCEETSAEFPPRRFLTGIKALVSFCRSCKSTILFPGPAAKMPEPNTQWTKNVIHLDADMIPLSLNQQLRRQLTFLSSATCCYKDGCATDFPHSEQEFLTVSRVDSALHNTNKTTHFLRVPELLTVLPPLLPRHLSDPLPPTLVRWLPLHNPLIRTLTWFWTHYDLLFFNPVLAGSVSGIHAQSLEIWLHFLLCRKHQPVQLAEVVFPSGSSSAKKEAVALKEFRRSSFRCYAILRHHLPAFSFVDPYCNLS